MFEIYGGQKSLKQWSLDQKLVVNELPLGAEVHFYNNANEEHSLQTAVYDITVDETTIRVCNIPNILLQESGTLKVWVPEKIQGLYGKIHTIALAREKYIAVEAADKPVDYDDIYTETELDSDYQSGSKTVSEAWTFTLEDDTTVTKKVVIAQ